jgi:hypothetical protein
VATRALVKVAMSNLKQEMEMMEGRSKFEVATLRKGHQVGSIFELGQKVVQLLWLMEESRSKEEKATKQPKVAQWL